MIQEGDRVDVLGGGRVVTVYGPASKRMASVKTDRGDYVEVECAKCMVLPPGIIVGDWVRARPAGHATECVFQVTEIAQIDPTTWVVRGESASGWTIGAFTRDCTLTTPPVEVKLGSEMRVVGVYVGGSRIDVPLRETPTDPLARYASLIADAETCVHFGPTAEQAKCIAALAKALRETQAKVEEAKRAMRSIVELAR